jgi:hypothetical protein
MGNWHPRHLPDVFVRKPLGMVEYIDGYLTQEYDSEHPVDPINKTDTFVNNKMEKKKVANIFDKRTPEGHKRWTQAISMIEEQQDVVIKSLMNCMRPNLHQKTYDVHINNIKEVGSLEMKMFAETYMKTTGALRASNRHDMRHVIDSQMTNRGLWPPTNPRR